MSETTKRSSYTLLVIDNEVGTFMKWFIQRLEKKGFRIRPCPFFADAVELLREYVATEEEKIDGVILGIMFPLRKEDEEAYYKIMGRKPKGVIDAMRAGLALLPLIQKKLARCTHFCSDKSV